LTASTVTVLFQSFCALNALLLLLLWIFISKTGRKTGDNETFLHIYAHRRKGSRKWASNSISWVYESDAVPLH